MTSAEIISLLPYNKPFLFVDELGSFNEKEIEGSYTYNADLPFYQGHFKDNPVTPGVILTETMAQIGLVCMGIVMMNEEGKNVSELKVAMTSTEVEFFKPVYPGEKVTVKSSKEYFRFNKLKCYVEMFNQQEELVCRGKISGMLSDI